MATVVEGNPVDRGLFTVPNAISVARLCCVPLFLYLLFGAENRVAAAWLLAALGATDWVDGYIARRFGQVSEIGKVLDPAADRLLFIVGITGIIIDGAAPLWFSLLVVIREAVVGVAMVVLTLLGMKRFDVTYLGKCATFALMFAFPLLLLHAGSERWQDGIWVAAWVFGIPGLVLSYYTAVAYVPLMRDNLRLGRLERNERTRQEQGT
ncbi:MAG: CDP-diacylglycerol--glycerol-3-phosphate 3-phosphatidyltransferase [Actinomycetota bacterium]